ncbi:unnamed protein product [Eruca vesicaria subsp. sativa]|uniref:peptide-methionine (S)-S-oxide reductase n=1 Tax=Eruca vesicaria subsp. sativa TaxID=29727 RepID=A0ABC8ISX2_ERUVS|nr:unnamed protein product [Eruca vesicaria subsp. sativa]
MSQTIIDPSPISQGNDDDTPLPGHEFAQFSAGCFWVYELVFQRVPGVTHTEVGYSQGIIHDPSHEDVFSGTTGHCAVVRVQYDPKSCSYDSLLDALWTWHSPPTIYFPNGYDKGPQHRSGIYFYTPEQEKVSRESLERKQQETERGKIMIEILPAKKFYRAEECHQQYLSKGVEFGRDQSTDKGCEDPIYVGGGSYV